MEREGADEFPLLLIGLLFKCAEPVVDTILRQPLAPLGGKDIRTALVTASLLEVVIQGTSGLVQEIDVAEFLPLCPTCNQPIFGPTWVCSINRWATSLTRQPAQYPNAKSAF